MDKGNLVRKSGHKVTKVILVDRCVAIYTCTTQSTLTFLPTLETLTVSINYGNRCHKFRVWCFSYKLCECKANVAFVIKLKKVCRYGVTSSINSLKAITQILGNANILNAFSL